MNCAAGIVLYNPEINRLKENLDSIYNQVDTVILVDNGSENIDEIDFLLSSYKRTEVLYNGKNLGIARALNDIVNEADRLGFEWVLTLDQDSVCQSNLIDEYSKVVQMSPDIAIVSCLYEDRNIHEQNANTYSVKEVEYCITSAAFTNVHKVKKVGGFDESMFIDLVDYDICFALRKARYKIVQIGYVGFLHEVGHSESHKLFGKTMIAYNHSSKRKYYWTRNSIYLARKYHLGFGFGFRRVFKRLMVTILYERNRREKIRAQLKGIYDGVKMPVQIISSEELRNQ